MLACTLVLNCLLAVVASQSQHQRLQLILERKGYHPPTRFYNYNTEKYYEMSPVFEEDFLTKVLRLKQGMEEVRSSALDGPAQSIVGFPDVCLTYNGQCIVDSVWSYFQDDMANLDKKIPSGFGFNLHDYRNHLQTCWSNGSVTDDGQLGLSCLTAAGRETSPDSTVAKFPMTQGSDAHYANAKQLLITFYMREKPEVSPATKAWLVSLGHYIDTQVIHLYPDIKVTVDPLHYLQNLDETTP